MLLRRASFGFSVAYAHRIPLRSLVTSQPRRKETVPGIAGDPIQMILVEKIKDFRGQIKSSSNNTGMSRELKAELDKIDQLLRESSAVMINMNLQNKRLGEKSLNANEQITPETTLNQDSDDEAKLNQDSDDEAKLSQDADEEATLNQDSDDEGIPSKVSDDEGIPSKVSDDEGIPSKVSDDEGIPSKALDKRGPSGRADI